ncbi:hypothetical protein Agabi119p4_3766 [Agaricus bisporus var. burnettii]|uniref:Uncharacterized protein n=1 Tax=Agaricus bisporus var. burnettii TaxID=192524 RepID=A0A8H7F5G7_AGABI|nr:hypothetical protein Agabi119p4_3766 [Agaricus bisporus var. burnettii]
MSGRFRRSSAMPLQFIRLLPFVFAGVMLSVFFPMDATSPGGGPRPPPPLYPGGTDQLSLPPGVVNAASDLHDLFNRFVAAFRDALRSIYGLTTTSNREDPRGARSSTHVGDYRAMLWASARAQGWAGLNSISQRTLSDIGIMSTHLEDGTVLRQEEEAYVRRLTARVLLEVFSSFNPRELIGPALLDSISSDFGRSGISTFSPILDDREIPFVATTITNATFLATAVIRLIDEDAMIEEAFHDFASNPSSWTHYIQSTSSILSIREIMQHAHHSQAQPSRALPIIPIPGGNFHHAFFRHGAPIEVDPEAATGPFALYDEDIEYIAALFVVAIIRFHRYNGIITA